MFPNPRNYFPQLFIALIIILICSINRGKVVHTRVTAVIQNQCWTADQFLLYRVRGYRNQNPFLFWIGKKLKKYIAYASHCPLICSLVPSCVGKQGKTSHLIRILLQFERAKVIKAKENLVRNSRIGKIAWFFDSQLKVLQRISDRISHITGLSMKINQSRNMQICNYGVGGHFLPHVDPPGVSRLKIL